MLYHKSESNKITRMLTAFCTSVLLVVSVFSFSLGIHSALNKPRTVSAPQTKSGTVIIIDAGHGGEDGGAQSKSGILEKHINLSISEYLDEIFTFFGYETIMTRSDDKLIYDANCSSMREKKVSDIHNRMSIIENNPGAIFLSIHQNHYEGSLSHGTQVFYSPNNEKSEKLAQSIQKTVVSDIQTDNKRLIKKSGKEIYLLCHAQVPAVMVECGFLSNEEEAQKLTQKEYQFQMALEIFKGTVSYLNQ